MLVIVEDGNIQHLLEFFFNVETFGCFNVFEIDPAKSRGDCRHNFDDLIGVMRIEFNIKHIHIRKFLEQHRLAFHHRLACQSAAVSET